MNNDLIRRRAAIDAIDAGYDGVAEDDYDYGLQDGMNRARFIIEDLPADHPELYWISVSDRLPELGVRVLVSDGDYIEESRLGKRYHAGYIWSFQTCWNDLEDWPYWMPFPALPQKDGD